MERGKKYLHGEIKGVVVQEDQGEQARKHLGYAKKREVPWDKRPLKTVSDADVRNYASMLKAKRKKALTKVEPVK